MNCRACCLGKTPFFLELMEPRTRSLFVSALVVALLSAIVAAVLAGCGYSLNFNEWQWIQLPLATLVLSLVVAAVAYLSIPRAGAGRAKELKVDGEKLPAKPAAATNEPETFLEGVGPQAGPHKIRCRVSYKSSGEGHGRWERWHNLGYSEGMTLRQLVAYLEVVRPGLSLATAAYGGRVLQLNEESSLDTPLSELYVAGAQGRGNMLQLIERAT